MCECWPVFFKHTCRTININELIFAGLVGASYYNPTMTASPYSTLPRKPGTGPHCGPLPPMMVPNPALAAPIMEMSERPTGLGMMRAGSLGRNAALNNGRADNSKPDLAHLHGPNGPGLIPRTLQRDDRESCV